MLKTPSPIIPIILAQKGGKMHPIYVVMLDPEKEATC